MVRIGLGRASFALRWLYILAIHVCVLLFYLFVAAFYWRLPSTRLKDFLGYQAIGMSAQHYRTIAIAHGICAVPHAVCLVAMVSGSLQRRRLAFNLALKLPALARMTSERLKPIESLDRAAGHSARLVTAVFGSQGLLGVNGRHYGSILVARELFETALQTAQAYKMSQLLPRVVLNRMYVALIVGNCWVTVAVRMLFAKRASHERYVSLVCDCVLDLVASVGISIIIGSYYMNDYDWVTESFYQRLWTDEKWLALALNELEPVFVTSWSDLATRVVFAAGVIVSLTDMKIILTCRRRVNRVSSVGLGRSQSQLAGPLWTAIPQSAVGSSSIEPVNRSLTPRSRVRRERTRRLTRCLSASTTALFAAWGAALLALHLHAASLPIVDQCWLQVRPWGAQTPGCYFIEMNCDRLGILGTAMQLKQAWRQVEPTSVQRMLIRHCPQLELPAMLSEFHALYSFKVYNSSIIDWSVDAGISAANHPRLATIFLIRVTLLNGSLPPGLIAFVMPLTLREITICASNLHQLPGNLHQVWPPKLTLLLELNELETVPASVFRLHPSALSLSGNPIGTIPSKLFEMPGLDLLGLGGVSNFSLPQHVVASPLRFLFLPDTNVSMIWPWIDKLLSPTRTLFELEASGTPYCAAYERIRDGELTEFPLAQAPHTYSMLMDAREHWSLIRSVVKCGATAAGSFYPLLADDAASAADTQRR